jgi:biopolymer transport protein ExbD
MITRPFNFEAQLKRPSSRMDAIPFINVCAVVLFFSILSSRFVLAPGITITLPATRQAAPDYALATRFLNVREVQGGEMLLFEGKILKLDSFEKELEKMAATAPGEILLIRMDRGVSAGLWVRVVELVRRAGFASIQVAVEPERAVNPAFP